MKEPGAKKPVERLYPFVVRSRNLIAGRDVLARSKRKLQFVLVTTDLSENSRRRILADFSFCPVVQRYTAAELEGFFQVKGAKVIGFKKSPLARSVYAELKEFRINLPAQPTAEAAPPSAEAE